MCNFCKPGADTKMIYMFCFDAQFICSGSVSSLLQMQIRCRCIIIYLPFSLAIIYLCTCLYSHLEILGWINFILLSFNARCSQLISITFAIRVGHLHVI